MSGMYGCGQGEVLINATFSEALLAEDWSEVT
jgi:hypothetical protein